MAETTCRSCSQPVIWSPVAASGALMPLDPDPQPQPAERLVAFNPKTSLCRILAKADLPMAQDWADHGVLFLRSHFATCPDASRWRNGGTGQ
jgi:hypothetical protein